MIHILDTHVLVWWFGGHRDRVTAAQRAILEAADATRPLGIASITRWEIATLVSLGRLRLPMPLRDWLDRATAEPLVRTHSITPAVAAEVAALPDDFHRDPGDRLIVATTRVLGGRLLTADARIRRADVVPVI